ncbi:IS3 family transposase [Clostridium tyrobutyricum]|uniref:IS3 family transposase n=1 Tax=Clostridium tyrobutyricum TaxID=1519 RepID=UPI001C38B248|nr:integrase core domain-containing protein [Clostridium tyrobutyricum]MBV4438174.1 integrase core domain-containing protein [Clostridium tyrobutyricum]
MIKTSKDNQATFLVDSIIEFKDFLPNYNAHIESFHALLEKECIAWSEIKNFTHGYIIIDDYIKFYNKERIHGSLSYMNPNEFIRKSMLIRICQ